MASTLEISINDCNFRLGEVNLKMRVSQHGSSFDVILENTVNGKETYYERYVCYNDVCDIIVILYDLALSLKEIM